ncbi:T9SS type A sorting domain-containing protein, partial [candidate division KSB1 bacterium]|nr:T9SS type A sorting domain-containing protein [candidate division KSB1 bacterium]
VRLEFSGRVNELYDLVVYNVIGQQVAEFHDLTVNSNGRHSFLWDAHDSYGMPLVPGVYFCHLQNGARIQTKKLVIAP